MRQDYQTFVKSIGARFLPVLGAFLIACCGLWPAIATTTIGFDGLSLADGEIIPQFFPNHVQSDGPGYTVSLGRQFTGTPGISVAWTGEPPIVFRSDWDGRGAVAQINPPLDPRYPVGLVFMTEPNYLAILDSFDLDLRSGAGPVDVDWSFTGSGFNASGNWQRTTPGRDTITLEYSGEPHFSGDHFFFFRINAGDPGSFAIDNLTFDQVLVPEPSILALAMFGGITAAALRRVITRR